MLDTMAGALNNNNKLYLNCKINLINYYQLLTVLTVPYAVLRKSFRNFEETRKYWNLVLNKVIESNFRN